SFGDVLGLSPWPTLNNTGDDLVLTDGNGTVIDAVNYDDSWYQDEFKGDGGFTLELINPQAQCNTGAANWIATNDLTGGTPGAQNSVLDVSPDVTAPEILEVTVTAGNALRITFTEGMDSLSLANASYTINPVLNVVTVVPELPQLTAVDLTLGTVIDPAQLYTITITGATDCSGNSIAPVALPFGIGVAPQPSDLVINEVFADPDVEIGSLPNAEFVEIYNPTGKLLRLDGLTFSDATSTTALPAAVALPGDHLIMCDDGFEDLYAPLGKTLPVVTMPSLNNGSDQLSLNDAQGTEIDRVNYNDSWYADNSKDDGGYTLERINPLDPCGGMSNWRASDDPSGGTPGRANSVLDSNAAIPLPAVLAVSVISLSQIEVTFNRQMDGQTLANGTYTFATAIGVVLAEAVLPDLTTVRLTLDATLTPGQAYDLTVDNVSDCAGNGLTSETVRFYLARPLDLVINEVLFNPRGNGSDFVELFNRSAQPINLQRWALARLDDQDSLIRNPINAPLTLLPGEFALLNEDGENILLEYPNAREERFV
ncbi:MAG: lamin tail domain-containing protein, partial [Bacteroidota bacterium]